MSVTQAANVYKGGTVTSLNQGSISAILTNATFQANGAAVFTFGAGASQRTFVALNDGTARFQANSDAIIEITGFTGNLNNLSII